MKELVIGVHQIKEEVLRRTPEVLMFPYLEAGIANMTSIYRAGLSYDLCHIFTASSFEMPELNDMEDEELLSLVFEMGNIAPKIVEKLNRSISVGDVISIDDRAYLVLPVGFRLIA